jgi:Rieske Fe-S protein
MTNTTAISRRSALLIATAGSATVALAACAPQTSPTTSTDAATPNADPGASPSAGTGGGAEVAKLADIPVGGSIEATFDGKPILITQPEAGTVVAFSAVCTHQGCIVKVVDSTFACPCHNSKFDPATGTVLAGPAPTPLASVAVTVSGASVTAS